MFKIEIWTCTNIKLTELGCHNVLWCRLPCACCALSFQLFPFSLFGWLLIHVPWQRMKRVPLSTSVVFICHLWFIFFFLRWKELILLIPLDITKSTMLEYGNVSILTVTFLYSEPYSSCVVLLDSLQSFTSPLLSMLNNCFEFWEPRWYCPPVIQLILPLTFHQ